jgi:hypothetical protein
MCVCVLQRKSSSLLLCLPASLLNFAIALPALALVAQMCHDRGYLVTPDEVKMDFETFQREHGDKSL